MGKQKKLLKGILDCFSNLNDPKLQNRNAQIYNRALIVYYFKNSLNKSNLVRRILNEIVMSDDDKLVLLKICFLKKSEL